MRRRRQPAGPLGNLSNDPGVDADLLARDVPGLVAGEEQRQIGDVLGLDIGDGHGLEEVEGRLGVFAGRLLEVGPEDLVEAVVVQQMGVAVGGVDRVDPDEPRRQVPSHLLAVTDERPLGPPVAVAARSHHRVVGRAGHQASGGSGDDDGGPVGEVRQGNGDGVHHTEQVDVGGIDEVGGMGVTQRHRQDAGVGHDDVQPSQVRHAGLERVAELGALPHVGLAGDNASIELLDGPLGLLQVLGCGQRIIVRLDLTADVDRDDVRPLRRHPDGMSPTLSSRRPGDEGDLSF